MWYYLTAISVLAVALCVYDKLAAITRRTRVQEAFLYFVAFMGGAFAMYIAMRIVRHKTKHLGFMVGLPIMLVFHAALLWYIYKNHGYLM